MKDIYLFIDIYYGTLELQRWEKTRYPPLSHHHVFTRCGKERFHLVYFQYNCQNSVAAIYSLIKVLYKLML